MNCNMRFRPVVCADGRLLLPLPGGRLEPQTAWEGMRFGSACLHPERPSRAVFQLVAHPPGWPTPRPASEPLIIALQMDEAALRRAAGELLELADEIALKPPKRKTRKATR
jgi:hypothetical protein